MYHKALVLSGKVKKQLDILSVYVMRNDTQVVVFQ